MVNGEKIGKLLREKGMTQQNMAREIGISEAMMCYIIQGLREPSVTVMARIATKLGCTVDELISK